MVKFLLILTLLLTAKTVSSQATQVIKFNGHDDDRVNVVQWTTTSEQNNDYFIIDRSEDGMDWVELDRIDGAGNSTIEINYEVIDKDPYTSYTYYRLSQVNFDGKVEEFEIISIENRRTVFYTYSKDGGTTIFLSSPYPFECYNMMGQLVSKGYGDSINIDGFNQGIYMFKIGRLTRKFFIH